MSNPLVSPGVSISVIDQSAYAPNSAGTVPLIIIATAEDKLAPGGSSIAPGTLAVNAGKVYTVSSQRDLVNTFGAPVFYQSTAGSALNGYDLNEYGLLAGYSSLGVTNVGYFIRAGINLSQLTPTNNRPVGLPSDGTYWLDTADSVWGIFEWDESAQEFVAVSPIVITDTSLVSSAVPKATVGSIGSYAVVTTSTSNPIYYKNYNNTWVLVGSTAWQQSRPAVSSVVNPTFNANASVQINTVNVSIGANITSTITNINSANITGVSAAAIGTKLALFATSSATSDGSTVDGVINLTNLVATPLADFGIAAGDYAGAALQISQHYNVPTWISTDPTPRPTGSVWVKTTPVNSGSNLDVKVFSTITSEFTTIPAPFYATDQAAIYDVDPTGGGLNISQGSVYVQYDVNNVNTATFKLFERTSTDVTKVTGSVTSPTFTSGHSVNISVSTTGTSTLLGPYTVTIGGNAATDLVTAISSADIDHLSASVEDTGAVSITHSTGGVIIFKTVSGTILADAGITSSLTNVRSGPDSDLIASNWAQLIYNASNTQPSTDPNTGTYWYDASTDVDIMINDGTSWKGYRNVTSDARGFNLVNTDPAGPIVASSAPTTQSDGTALVYGDLWISTADLTNYPLIYRWQRKSSVDQWILLDNSDHTTLNGVLFADARFMLNSTNDSVTGTIPSIAACLTSNYVDLDKPNPALYPRGMLLFNTRRSGFNVKRYVVNYFNATTFPSEVLPTETSTWVSASGYRNDGSPFMGPSAVRNIVVESLRAAIDNNTVIREEQYNFNVITCPGYPELVANMVSLNADRKNTAFVLGDTPMTLTGDTSTLHDYVSNVNNEAETTASGIATRDPYLSYHWPSGQTNDLSGNTVVVPPSHMTLRTLIKSDNVSFPWFAFTGSRRGLIDNASSIGYVDPISGNFVTTGVGEGTRDILYQNGVNPLTFMPDTGLQIFGNKTSYQSSTALDRINVARLVVYLRYVLDRASRNFLFEQNDQTTRNEIKHVIESIMNDLIAKRGVYDYLVVCDGTNNTPDRIDRNELWVDVAIEPVKSVEFIYIPVRLMNTGSIAAGIAAATSVGKKANG